MHGIGGRPKKLRHKPAPIDTANSGVYESLDAEYNIPLDYTYPTPSPTAKYDPEKDTAYSYITNNGNTTPSLSKKNETTVHNDSKNPKNIYHSIGPDVVQHYEIEGTNGAAGGSNSVVKKMAAPQPDSSYHYLNAESDVNGFGGGAVVYEDPNLPRFRVSQLLTPRFRESTTTLGVNSALYNVFPSL